MNYDFRFFIDGFDHDVVFVFAGDDAAGWAGGAFFGSGFFGIVHESADRVGFYRFGEADAA